MPLDFTPKKVAKFWSYIDQSGGPNVCWPWMKSRNAGGYGVFMIDNQRWLAHRLAYALTHREHPGELCILHRCDNPPCCNPAHHWAGNRAENAQDSATKGRHADQAGSANGNAKLTEQDVLEIRTLYWPRKMTRAMLAEKFGVSIAAIEHVIYGDHWEHITP